MCFVIIGIDITLCFSDTEQKTEKTNVMVSYMVFIFRIYLSFCSFYTNLKTQRQRHGIFSTIHGPHVSQFGVFGVYEAEFGPCRTLIYVIFSHLLLESFSKELAIIALKKQTRTNSFESCLRPPYVNGDTVRISLDHYETLHESMQRPSPVCNFSLRNVLEYFHPRRVDIFSRHTFVDFTLLQSNWH